MNTTLQVVDDKTTYVEASMIRKTYYKTTISLNQKTLWKDATLLVKGVTHLLPKQVTTHFLFDILVTVHCHQSYFMMH